MTNFFSGKKKLFAFLILIAIALAIPLTVFVSQQQQTIKQRAEAKDVKLYFTESFSEIPLTDLKIASKQEKTLELWLDPQGNSVSGFDIVISVKNIAPHLLDTWDDTKQVFDLPIAATRTNDDSSGDSNTLRYARFSTRNTSVNKKLRLFFFNVQNYGQDKMSLAITDAKITSIVSSKEKPYLSAELPNLTISSSQSTPAPTVAQKSAPATPSPLSSVSTCELNILDNASNGYLQCIDKINGARNSGCNNSFNGYYSFSKVCGDSSTICSFNPPYRCTDGSTCQNQANGYPKCVSDSKLENYNVNAAGYLKCTDKDGSNPAGCSIDQKSILRWTDNTIGYCRETMEANLCPSGQTCWVQQGMPVCLNLPALRPSPTPTPLPSSRLEAQIGTIKERIKNIKVLNPSSNQWGDIDINNGNTFLNTNDYVSIIVSKPTTINVGGKIYASNDNKWITIPSWPKDGIASLAESIPTPSTSAFPTSAVAVPAATKTPTPVLVKTVTIQGHYVDQNGEPTKSNGRTITISEGAIPSPVTAANDLNPKYLWKKDSLPPSNNSYTVTASSLTAGYTISYVACTNTNCDKESARDYIAGNSVSVNLSTAEDYADIYFKYVLSDAAAQTFTCPSGFLLGKTKTKDGGTVCSKNNGQIVWLWSNETKTWRSYDSGSGANSLTADQARIALQEAGLATAPTAPTLSPTPTSSPILTPTFTPAVTKTPTPTISKCALSDVNILINKRKGGDASVSLSEINAAINAYKGGKPCPEKGK